MKMYGLFSMTYDYYEWEDLICVSRKVDKLIDQVKKLPRDFGDVPPLINKVAGESNKELMEREVRHLLIKEIEVI